MFSADSHYSGNPEDFCFVRYLIDLIQAAQIRLKSDQMVCEADFSHSLMLIREIGAPCCISSWRKMDKRKDCEFLIDDSVHLLGVEKDCAICPFRKGRKNPALSSVIRIARDTFAKCDNQYEVDFFLEQTICRIFPRLLEAVSVKSPEDVAFLRKHYESPKLFCQDITCEIRSLPMEEFLSFASDKPVVLFARLLTLCQKKLFFRMTGQHDDEGNSWIPQTPEDHWHVAHEMSGLLIQVCRFLPLAEDKNTVHFLPSPEELKRIMWEYFPFLQEVRDRDSKRDNIHKIQGVSMRKLLRRYCRENDEIAGDPEPEIQKLYMRVQRLEKEDEFRPIAIARRKMKLYSFKDAAQILRKVIADDSLSTEKAEDLAFVTQENIPDTGKIVF